MWDDADSERELEYDRDRQALSQLLSARGEQHAAALVAVSAYRDEYVDGLDGGQYDAILAVPPELYDQARGEFREVIESACADTIGQYHYSGLRICVRRPPYDPDWVAKVVAALNPRWVPSERVGARSPDQQGASPPVRRNKFGRRESWTLVAVLL